MGTCFGRLGRSHEDELDKLIAKYPVLVITKTTCPACNDAKSILEEAGIDYAVVELDTCKKFDKIGDLLILKYHQDTVPAILVNGRIIRGNEKLSKLCESGKLHRLTKTDHRKPGVALKAQKSNT